MNMIKIIGILFILFTGIANCATVGTTGADFLKYIPTARASAMGGAAVASSPEGAESLYWNPAINAKYWNNEIITSYIKWWDNVEYGYIGMAFGKIGINVTFLQMDEFVVTDAEGNETKESFIPRDLAAGISYSFPMLREDLSFGIMAKYIRRELEDAANAFAIDVTALYNMPTIKGLKVAASIDNMGSKIDFGGTKDQLPLTFRMGAAYRPAFLPGLTAAIDLLKPIDDSMNLPYGVEFYPIELFSWFTMSDAEYRTPAGLAEDIIAIRIGHDGSLMDLFDGLSAGFGIKLSRLKFDYAFKPYSDINDAHRISLIFLF